MMGAIVGDIVGSVYEWHNTKTKDFPFTVNYRTTYLYTTRFSKAS